MGKGKHEQKTAPKGDNILQSFCARVIGLCHEVQDANDLLYLQGLKEQAHRLEAEATGIQNVYGGGRPLRKDAQ